VGQIFIHLGGALEEIEDSPCGNIVVLSGLEKHILASGLKKKKKRKLISIIFFFFFFTGALVASKEAYNMCGTKSRKLPSVFRVTIELRSPAGIFIFV
jgi:hypothetical protein